MHENRHKWMVETQKWLFLHSPAIDLNTLAQIFARALHTLTHTQCKHRNGSPPCPPILPPFHPTVETVPHLICNSKFQKEHLL